MENFVDKFLITTLHFWIRKIKHGDCTREEKQAVLDAIESYGGAYGTIDDFADFFGKSKDAVSSVIKRRYIGKPKRNVVMYSFSKFLKIVPKSWHAGEDKSGC